MMSEAVPACIWVVIDASNSFEPWYWIVMPVASSNALIEFVELHGVFVGERAGHADLRALHLAVVGVRQTGQVLGGRAFGAGANGCRRRSRSRSLGRFRPGSVDLLQDRVQIGRAGEVVGHALPEGTRADRTGHQIRRVEADGVGRRGQPSNRALQRHAVPVELHVVLRTQRTAGRQPTLHAFAGGEELHDGAGLRPLRGGRHDVAGHQERLAVLRIHTRQVEHVIVHARLRLPSGRRR